MTRATATTGVTASYPEAVRINTKKGLRIVRIEHGARSQRFTPSQVKLRRELVLRSCGGAERGVPSEQSGVGKTGKGRKREELNLLGWNQIKAMDFGYAGLECDGMVVRVYELVVLHAGAVEATLARDFDCRRF